MTPFIVTTSANAQALGYASTQPGAFPSDQAMTDPSTEATEDGVLPERLRRTTVALNTSEAPGTIIIDTGNTALYYVLGGGRAIRYGVASAARASPGPAPRPSAARRSGRTGIRRPR